jgi:hypothetical protein
MRPQHVLLALLLIAVPRIAAAEPTPVAGETPTIATTATPVDHASNGFVARFNFGGSAPVGEGTDNTKVGVRVGGALGYQIKLLDKLSVTPELWFGYYGWGAEGDASASMFVFTAGGQADYYVWGPISTWVGVHLGGGSASVSAGGADLSKGGFAIHLEAGATYMFLPYLGAGLGFGYTKTASGEENGVKLAANSVDFGLQFKGKHDLF